MFRMRVSTASPLHALEMFDAAVIAQISTTGETRSAPPVGRPLDEQGFARRDEPRYEPVANQCLQRRIWSHTSRVRSRRAALPDSDSPCRDPSQCTATVDVPMRAQRIRNAEFQIMYSLELHCSIDLCRNGARERRRFLRRQPADRTS